MKDRILRISSRTNPLVVLLSSLSEKKYRDKHRLFLAEGRKLLGEAVEKNAPIRYILIQESKQDAYSKTAEEALAKYPEAEILLLSDSCFEKISTEKSPEGISVVIKYLDFSKKYIKMLNVDFLREKQERYLLLSSIRDPGNLGTILRSAGAFGVDAVLLSPDCTDPYHPRAVRAAMGAVFRVPTVRLEDAEAFVSLFRAADRRALAAELRPGAHLLAAYPLRSSDLLIIGNEGHGIPASLSAACDASVYIPIAEEAESLNAAAAATVLLWEQGKCKD